MQEIPKKMKGVYLTGFGGLDKLEYRTDIDVPRPKKGEVLVKIGAAAVNNTDINTRIGWYSKNVTTGTTVGGSEGFEDVDTDGSWMGETLTFPRIQGADSCGKIVTVGDGVDKNRIGERVVIRNVQERPASLNGLECFTFGSESNGTFSEYTTARSEETFTINSELSDEELSVLPCAYATANNLICRVDVKENDTVLITGASGGVGSALIQLVKARGAKVIGVCSEENEELIKNIGADKIIFRGEDYTEKLDEMSVDVVLDIVAGDKWSQLLKILKKGGKLGMSGAIAGPIVNFDVRDLYLKDISIYGATYQTKGSMLQLIDFVEQGKVRPIIAKTYPLKDIVEAQKAFLSKKYVGKIVLKVQEESNLDE
ncbi:alcohol dehydrogenase [Tetragenococcus halophilus subsp. flandriensis]|uniref:alcohol dehydrogenase family protein n=1 Tax=Tetragenococcus halophilus TaxID=51669 RepID=UPI0023E93252|nr:alcohol dehydrogenase family protein [Tetragenococcus halophilus]GMA08693.1 alcohol dehydrogenase [Tetragenococcus halophilus subsp. flandriensis]